MIQSVFAEFYKKTILNNDGTLSIFFIEIFVLLSHFSRIEYCFLKTTFFCKELSVVLPVILTVRENHSTITIRRVSELNKLVLGGERLNFIQMSIIFFKPKQLLSTNSKLIR